MYSELARRLGIPRPGRPMPTPLCRSVIWSCAAAGASVLDHREPRHVGAGSFFTNQSARGRCRRPARGAPRFGAGRGLVRTSLPGSSTTRAVVRASTCGPGPSRASHPPSTCWPEPRERDGCRYRGTGPRRAPSVFMMRSASPGARTCDGRHHLVAGAPCAERVEERPRRADGGPGTRVLRPSSEVLARAAVCPLRLPSFDPEQRLGAWRSLRTTHRGLPGTAHGFPAGASTQGGCSLFSSGRCFRGFQLSARGPREGLR